MRNSHQKIVIILLVVFCHFGFAQEADPIVKTDTIIKVNPNEFNALSPAKAAFRSAVLPGLGQAYNKKYWKIPLVYATIGTGVYFYYTNNRDYNRARDAFKLRKYNKPDEFDGIGDNIYLSDEALIAAQKSYKKDRDLSLLVSVAFYLLQIVEASTNAHLLQHDVDNNLSFRPKLLKQDISNNSIVGASINFKF